MIEIASNLRMCSDAMPAAFNENSQAPQDGLPSVASLIALAGYSDERQTPEPATRSLSALNDSIALGPDNLLSRFNSQFGLLPANTFETVRAAQRIRYQVYCVEHPHEQADNSDGLETDEFDAHSVQSLLICRSTAMALGTMRLILPLANRLDFSFPVQRVMDAKTARIFNRLPLHATGEVSRFSISRQLRRIANNSSVTGTVFQGNSGVLMRLGLMQTLVRMSVRHGITHWCAAMEPKLLRMLSAMAIRFRPVGPLVEYHGLRQPCFGVIADILSDLRCERPSFWSVITDDGRLGNRH